MTEITHLYSSEEQSPLYMLIDNHENTMHIFDEHLLRQHLETYPNSDRWSIELGGEYWYCLTHHNHKEYPTKGIKTFDDIMNLCNNIKRGDMILSRKYPEDFLNVMFDLHIRRIL